MKIIVLNSLQGFFKKLAVVFLTFIYPIQNYAQVFQVDNQEVSTRVILDKEYIVISKFETESGKFVSTFGGYYKPGDFINLNEKCF